MKSMYIFGILAVLFIMIAIAPVGAKVTTNPSGVINFNYLGSGSTHIVKNIGTGIQVITGSQSGNNNVLVAKNINNGGSGTQSISVTQTGIGNVCICENINIGGSTNQQSIYVVQG